MRNLKKFLALVLAMMMAFSLMTVANAKDAVVQYPDLGTVLPEFEEAVDVLSGMSVFKGKDTGSFDPKGEITRAEVAAIIYRLVTGDVTDSRAVLYTGTHHFTDVPAGAWYEGYVSYCAAQGIIKGSGGKFYPMNKVTGYEVLAMVLRAMGYDANGEFTGPNWRVGVATYATQRQLLVDVNKTHYANTLYQNSAREVVASIVFQAALAYRVKYTPAFGYQSGDYNTVDPSTIPGRYNDYTPLGQLNFDLAKVDNAVIVGNQETGESNTRVSIPLEVSATGLVYAYGVVGYDSANSEFKAVDEANKIYAANRIMQFKDNKVGDKTLPTGTTGLDLFAHKTRVWYKADSASVKTTYAILDKASLVDAVKLADADTLVVNTPATAATLGAKAKDKGFTVDKGTEVHDNMAFNRYVVDTGKGGTNTVDTLDNTYKSPSNLYLLVSNSTDKSLDVVISLNIETAKITGVDNVNTIKTVSVPETAPTFIAAANELPAGSGAFVLEQAQLVGDSTKTLDQKEIGVHIDGTGPTGADPAGYVPVRTGATYEDAWFLLKAVTEKVSGKVVAYNTDNGKVTLDNGTVLDQSILYDTVVDGSIPQTDTYSNLTYEFYLDPVGKYLGAAPSRDVSFVYGTYMDYEQKVNTSDFQYFLTGVNDKGEKVTVPVAKKNGTLINSTSALDVPFRDTANQANPDVRNGVGSGIYKGWVLSGTNACDANTADVWASAGMKTGGTIGTHDKGIFDQTPAAAYGITPVEGDVLIGSTETTLGAVLASSDYDGNGTGLYFTDSTKFIVVSGYGTESLKATVYDGISALKGTNTYVNLKMAATSTARKMDVGAQHITGATTMAEMTYFSISPFVYAQTGKNAAQADVVFLPDYAIDKSGVNSLYYVGSAAPTLINANGEDATQFTMYQNGEKKNVWVDGFVKDFGNATASGSAQTILDDIANKDSATYCDKFYQLVESGLTANDGQPIYNVVGTAIAPSADAKDGVITISLYTASTYSSQTGTFTQTTQALTTAMRNVAKAKVTNVNLDQKGAANAEWPGISDLTTLNQAGSLQPGGYGGNTKLSVTAVLNPDNALIVDYIYVCYLQPQT